MLCVNNNLTPTANCNFKAQETKYVVKIGKKVIDSDAYANMVDKSILCKPVKSIYDFKSVIKTCNFVRAQLQQFKSNQEKILYKKLIQRCIRCR